MMLANIRKGWKQLLTAFLVCAVSAGLAYGQVSTGQILGMVTDPSGSAIPGASVTVTNVGTSVTWRTVSDAQGEYKVPDLPIGNYTVTVDAPGFSRLRTVPQTLNINQSLLVNVKLNVGGTTQTVEVTTTAPQVETQSPTVGTLVTGAPIENLPLNGRNTLSLAITMPGVVPTPGAGNTGGGGSFSIAGGQPDSVLYLLDGGINNSVSSNGVVYNPNPDTIAEFRVLENNYTAEYGKSAGGVITEETKSGTNAWHGSLFNYLRNTDLDANLFFNKEQPALGLPLLPRPVLIRNQFGGTLGGPVVRNKLFFFFGYEGQRQTQTETAQSVNIYTPAELAGDFSQAANGSPDPGVVAFLQQNPYFQPDAGKAAQGIIAPGTLDAAAQAYIAAGLIPSNSVGTETPVGSFQDKFDQYTGHFDYFISSKNSISVVLGKQTEPTTTPVGLDGNNGNGGIADVPGYGSTTTTHTQTANAAWTRTISPSMVNVARLVVERLNYLGSPTTKPPSGSTLGVNIQSDDYFGPQDISWDSDGLQIGFNPNIPDSKADTTFSFSDMYSWIHGRNTWNFGGWFTDTRERTTYAYQTNGAFEFNGGGIGGSGIGSGNDLADFLFGLPDYFYESAKGINGEYQHEYAAFVQDAWQARPNLTFTLGLRYEYYSPETDPGGKTFDVIPGLTSQRFTNAPPGFVVPGDPGAPKGWYFPDYHDIAPRLGFAWNVGGSGKTSLRGGAGLFFDSLNGWMADWDDDVPPYWGSAYLEYFAPNTDANGVNSGFGGAPGIMEDPYGASGPYAGGAIQDPFPSLPPPKDLSFVNFGYVPFSTSVWFVDPHLTTPYIYEYNLTLERQLTSNLMAQIGYIGSITKHEITWADDNWIDPKTITCSKTDSSGQCTQQSGTRVYNEQLGAAGETVCQGPCYSSMTTFDNLVNGNYNALIAGLNKRTGNIRYLGDAFFSASFTWSHGFTNGSEQTTRNGTSDYYFPAANPNAEYGNSDIDLPYRFVLSGGWTLPFDQWGSQNALTKKVIGGWILYPIFSAQAGSPIDMRVYSSVNPQSRPGPSGYGDQNAIRPDVIQTSNMKMDPRKLQTITDGLGNSVTGNFSYNPANFGLDSCIASSSYSTCPLGFYGTYRRNSIFGPGSTNLDMALGKKIPITERVTLGFRAEAFNMFNHAEFVNPPGSNTRVTSTSFGVISSTLPQRIMQLALRIDF